MLIWKRPGYRPRLVCTSREAQVAVWPYAFSSVTRPALGVAQWAGRNGALVHPALRLVPLQQRGFGVISLRDLTAGTPLMSIPMRIALATSAEDRQHAFIGARSPVEQLSHMVARGLVDATCPWTKYLQYLHDTHNMDADEALEQHEQLQQEVDRIVGGNALVMNGVSNAPFMEKHELATAKYRVQWVRLREACRELQQAVPHFASQAAAWALSMSLSRSVAIDEGERMIMPLLDALNHDPNPTAHFVVVKARPKGRLLNESRALQRLGMANHNRSEDHCHLVAVRNIRAGREVTLRYSDQEADDNEGQDFWRLTYGFVPQKSKRSRIHTRSRVTLEELNGTLLSLAHSRIKSAT